MEEAARSMRSIFMFHSLFSPLRETIDRSHVNDYTHRPLTPFFFLEFANVALSRFDPPSMACEYFFFFYLHDHEHARNVNSEVRLMLTVKTEKFLIARL